MPDETATKERLVSELHGLGFDLVGWTGAGRYNSLVEAKYHLPLLNQADPVVAVVGNTRGLWGRFLDALQNAPEVADSEHPLDSWVESQLEPVGQGTSVLTHMAYAHTMGQGAIAIQTLGALAGMGFAAPCRLSIHRKHGPWFSFRAAMVLDIPHTARERDPVDTCTGCLEKPCMSVSQHVAVAPQDATFDGVRAQWENWLAIRKACPIGREFQFSHSQSAYHYTHDRRWLLESLRGS